MIRSSHNQLANSQNPYQGPAKKALCVCSAGLLRSPSIAKFLTELGNYNTRACGTSDEYALIPLSTALLLWADEIHVVKEQEKTLRQELGELEDSHRIHTATPVYVYDIPDCYGTFAPELMEEIEQQFKEVYHD